VEREYVGIDLHRRRSVIVRRTADGEVLPAVRVDNDPLVIGAELAKAGPNPEVVVEATYGWYWLVDLLGEGGAEVHLAHPLGNNWGHRRVKNDEREAADLIDLLRLGRLAESWIAPPELRELRELVRYRAKLVALRSGLKSQVHAVLAKRVRGQVRPQRVPPGPRRVGRHRLPASGRAGCRARDRRAARHAV
jgi:transposase